MRFTTILMLGLSAVSSGCSVLGNLQFGGPHQLDPTKIYLESRAVYLDRHVDLDRYACASGPLVCSQWGVQWKCSCP